MAWKKYVSSAKIFIYRQHNQFTNQITLLCDGKDHCKYRINAAKPVCGNEMKPTTLKYIGLNCGIHPHKQNLIFELILHITFQVFSIMPKKTICVHIFPFKNKTTLQCIYTNRNQMPRAHLFLQKPT